MELLLVLSALVAADAPNARPNVLWLCADDLAAYVCGAYGNRLARTPNLDGLAATATRYTRAYCNSPVCTASRMSFLTGRYPRSIGVTQLKTPLPESESTIAEMLKAVGYRTAGIGKMHFNSQLRHGFDVLVDVAEHRKWLRTQPKTGPPSKECLGVWRPFRDPAAIWLNSNALPQATTVQCSLGRFLATKAVEFMEANDSRPYFAFVSFHEPHSPFHFPVEYAGRRRRSEFFAPPLSPSDRWQVPEIFASLSDDDKRGIQAAYYTSTEFMDGCVGHVLDAIDRSPALDNTLVIFCGDHGYMLGQHGRFEKHCGFEPALRVPLMVRWPKSIARPQVGAVCHQLVEMIDIVPTILSCCAQPIPDWLHGQVLAGPPGRSVASNRTLVHAAYSENEEAYVVGDEWKLIYGTGKRVRLDGYRAKDPTPGRYIKLYNLASDPDELVNLANDPAQRLNVDRHLASLRSHLRATLPADSPARSIADPMEFIDRALQPADRPPH